VLSSFLITRFARSLRALAATDTPPQNTIPTIVFRLAYLAAKKEFLMMAVKYTTTTKLQLLITDPRINKAG